MKTRAIFIMSLLLLTAIFVVGNNDASASDEQAERTFKIYSAPNLASLVNKWADQYALSDNGKAISVSTFSEKQLDKLPGTANDISIVTDDELSGSLNRESCKIVVAQNIVVPVINADSPLLKQLIGSGISMKQLRQILVSEPEEIGKILNISGGNPVHLIVSDDEFVVSALGRLVGENNLKVVKAGDRVISNIKSDQYAIGFCSFTQLVEDNSQSFASGVRILPIDKNNNGKIDYVENIYENPQVFSRGVWIGKYPKAFCSKIFAVSGMAPGKNQQTDFLKWLLADGQQYTTESNHSSLAYAERLSQLSKFDSPESIASVPVEKTTGVMGILLLIVVLIVAMGIVLDLAFRRRARYTVKTQLFSGNADSVFDQHSVRIPQGVFFDKTHTWAFMRKNGLVKVGLDGFMARVTGNVSRVDMKKPGEQVRKGEILFSVMSKGRLLNFYSPVSGTIVETNRNLKSNASLLSHSPFNEGWVYLVQPLNWGLEIQYLSLAEKYAGWITSEFTRLKDFFTSVLKSESPEMAHVVLQDGGALKNNVLSDFGPKVWEDFQTQFIDVSK